MKLEEVYLFLQIEILKLKFKRKISVIIADDIMRIKASLDINDVLDKRMNIRMDFARESIYYGKNLPSWLTDRKYNFI